MFLHSGVSALSYAWSCVCACIPTCVCVCACLHGCVVGLSLRQALDMLLAGDTVCGFSSWLCSSRGRKRCVPPKPPAPPSIINRAALSLLSLLSLPGPQSLGCGLWMSATSWLSAQGLAGDWPVVEVQYQGLSVSSSFPFLSPRGTGCSQWHNIRSPAGTQSCD